MGEIVKLAVVGKSKQANTWVARRLWETWRWKVIGLDDELDKFLRRIKNRTRVPIHHLPEPVNWQIRQAIYDAIQKVDATFFVDRAIYLSTDPRRTMHVVIPDARYLEEVKALQAAGFIFVRVTMPKENYKSNSIKRLNYSTNSGAIDYYEWFAQDVDMYIKATYTIHLDLKSAEGRAAGRSAVDLLRKKLTE